MFTSVLLEYTNVIDLFQNPLNNEMSEVQTEISFDDILKAKKKSKSPDGLFKSAF